MKQFADVLVVPLGAPVKLRQETKQPPSIFQT